MNTHIPSSQAARPGCTPALRLMLAGPLLAAALRCACFAADTARANPGPGAEYQVKAAFLFNFPMFVEWPAEAFAETNSPICVGLLGASPISDPLRQIAEGGNIRGRGLQIKALSRVEDAKGCHVLFVGRSEKVQMQKILSAVAGTGVLTVGEMDGFCKRGGIINFFIQDKRVRFEINPSAARRAGIRISAQLLNLGLIVEDEPAGGTP